MSTRFAVSTISRRKARLLRFHVLIGNHGDGDGSTFCNILIGALPQGVGDDDAATFRTFLGSLQGEGLLCTVFVPTTNKGL
ncbi:hypothetical protein ACOSP7_018554 [Xanthoceras sorbifolium]